MRDLNALYRATPALYEKDCQADGFQWIDGGNADESVFSWVRYGIDESKPILAVANFTPVPRTGYRIGVPAPGFWAERLNTDSMFYGGSNQGNGDGVTSEPVPAHGCDHSIALTVPPLATVFFELR